MKEKFDPNLVTPGKFRKNRRKEIAEWLTNSAHASQEEIVAAFDRKYGQILSGLPPEEAKKVKSPESVRRFLLALENYTKNIEEQYENLEFVHPDDALIIASNLRRRVSDAMPEYLRSWTGYVNKACEDDRKKFQDLYLRLHKVEFRLSQISGDKI